LFPNLSFPVDNFFADDDGFFRTWQENRMMPAVNVKETDKMYNLEVAAPGMKKDDFKIELDKGVLTISSENNFENEETKENYTRREFGYTAFTRSFWLPENVTEDNLKATYKNGVLLVSIPKKEIEDTKALKRTIPIS
jgi:HSP20 family protein